jgi:hypothetical protein
MSKLLCQRTRVYLRIPLVESRQACSSAHRDHGASERLADIDHLAVLGANRREQPGEPDGNVLMSPVRSLEIG